MAFKVGAFEGAKVTRRCLTVAGAAVDARAHEGVKERTVGHGHSYQCDVD